MKCSIDCQLYYSTAVLAQRSIGAAPNAHETLLSGSEASKSIW